MPMSARIDHHSLVITGQMLMNRNVCIVINFALLVLVTIMDNALHVLMDTTYQEQLVRSVMLNVPLVSEIFPHNAQDAQKVTSWTLPQTQLG